MAGSPAGNSWATGHLRGKDGWHMNTDRTHRTQERVKVAEVDGEFQGMLLLMAIILLMAPLIALFTS